MWESSFRWSFRPNSACGSKETMIIGNTHPTLWFLWYYNLALNWPIKVMKLIFRMNFGIFFNWRKTSKDFILIVIFASTNFRLIFNLKMKNQKISEFSLSSRNIFGVQGFSWLKKWFWIYSWGINLARKWWYLWAL